MIHMPRPTFRVAPLFLAILFMTAALAAAATTYHGNVDSRIFHDSSCRYFDCKKCTVVFESREAAVQAGFRPCKVCKP